MEVPLQICRKNETAIDTTDVFTTSQRFVTREEVIRWVKETGINNKVTVIIARSDTETGKRGRSNKVIFACDKGGKYKDKSETQSATKRCGCPFKIRSTPAKDGSGWKVDVKCGVHNHGLPDRLEGHSFVGRLTTDEKQHVADLTKRHVPPRHILTSLQERDPENVTRITQIYKHKSVIEAEIRGPRSEIQHLLKLIEEANYVYWSRKRDDCEVVRDIFWAHPDSVKLLNLFPTVLIMDATYKTNKYRQPLFEIVGMTSTELTFAVAFAYMECEQTESYIWVLDKLKQLFVKKDVVPQVILTDRDLALMKAVEVVFPTTHNLLCRFHINQNVGMKCKEYVMKDMRETIGTLWKDVVWASNEVEYGVRLQYLEQACFACTNFLDYVKNTWLIPHRQRFVGAWINQVLHFGNTTTNRVESAHWKLKQMLGNSLGDMVKVWEAMNSNLKIQIGNIRASFQKSFYEVEHAHISPFYDNLRGSVSRAALRRIAEELSRLDYVLNSRETCGCTMRTSYGLPCACEMGRSIVVGIPLQIESVHLQWRILSMEGDLPLDEEAGSEVDMNNAIDELWRRFKSLDVVGKRALKSRVCEIAYPTTTSLCPPPEKIKTKGGVKRKGKKPVGYDVYRDPSGFEYADQASQCSQKQSQASQTSRKQSQSKKQSQAKDEDFTLQFPCHIRPYITEIVNVVADGNCGFRAIASWHGYSEDGWAMVRRDLDMELREKKDLYERLFGLSLSEVRNGLLIDHVGFQPPEKWLTLPEMGYLIANRYNIILVLLGNPCLTFFPMTTTFSPSAPTYCIGLVNRNHYLRVNMKEGFPLPPVTVDWMKFRLQVATSWMLGFAGRLQHWHHLTPMLPSRVNID
ncbi:PKS-NRPS hybrid synthetase cheA-like isoform X1 [Vicia villosa]|uniref:PKS-NRPS hybrid synthetase cheA-like isoform X1 n=1 Tax=Vicia villosa TaxID=3911 RepID=UPI00273CB3F0|nr:PKS-NRPS hybrid synthetase cheA-like isoform X1 [Vicia villosa]